MDLGRVDHLIVATPDVASTVGELERRLGVQAIAGGRHAVWATRNAIVPLGPRVYLEVLGPDPDAPRPAAPRPLAIDSLAAPRLATWVANGTDLARLAAEAAAATIDLGRAERRSRQRPDGAVLSWTMTDVMKPREGGVVPFFIDWGDTPHPAGGAPARCRLVDLSAEHPDSGRVRRILASLGLDLIVNAGRSPALVATLETPHGIVVLRTDDPIT